MTNISKIKLPNNEIGVIRDALSVHGDITDILQYTLSEYTNLTIKDSDILYVVSMGNDIYNIYKGSELISNGELTELATEKDIDGLFVSDISMYDANGKRMARRSTANCYVVRDTGIYRFPLVYGNAIKNGLVNSAAYTKVESNYGADFVNHLGNLITNPFIENNSGCTPNQVGLLWQTSVGMISDVGLYSGGDCKYIEFTVSAVPTTNGVAVLYVTDSNNNIMWSWMIWVTDDDLSDITIVNNTNISYNLLGLPLGAIWNSERTRYSVPHFQWGRKDPMCPPSAYNSTSNMTLYDISGNVYSGFGNQTGTTVADSIKLPNKFFTQYDATSYNWNNLSWFNNFWNAAETANSSIGDNQHSAVKTIYDPCPVNHMLPASRFATGFTTTGGNTSTLSEFNVIGDWSNGWTMKKNSSDTVGLYFPAAGIRDRESGGLINVGSYGYWWTFAPYSQTNARYLYFYSAYMVPLYSSSRAYGFGVWPARE